MKFIHFLLLSFLPTTHVLAQATDSRANAIGVFGETNALFAGVGDANMSTLGIQYNHQYTKHWGFKASVGYCGYSYSPQPYIRLVSADTAIGKSLNRYGGMCVLGIGINFEQQFYKRLYFFAGFEIRAGYGNVTQDTTLITESYGLQIDPVTGNRYLGIGSITDDKEGPSASIFYAAFTPSVGLKLEFKKFCIGTEFMNYFTYRSIKPDKGTADNLVDFDFANLTQRVFVQYKF